MATAAERLAREISDLRRRLEGLERSAAADLRSIDDGTLTAYDEDGNEVVLLGRQDDGTYGVQGKNGAQIVADAVAEGSITETEIADDSISTPKLQANAVTADVLAAEISLANKRFIAGDPAGERAEVNGSGFEAYNASGERVFQVTGGDVFVSGSVESTDYVQAEQGWRLDSTTAQFTNLNTIQELGADTTSTRALILDGADLGEELLPALSVGAHAYGQRWAGGNSVPVDQSNSYGIRIANFNPGEIDPSRLYFLQWHFTLANGYTGTGVGHFLTYSTTRQARDSDPVLTGSEHRSLVSGYPGYGPTLTGWTIYRPSADHAENLSFALNVQALDGDNLSVKHNSTETKVELVMIDLGRKSDTPNALVLRNQSGTADPPDPTQTYTKSWYPTWGRSFNGNGSIYENYGNETNDLYQGYYSGTHGNTKSMVGYDDANIRSRLNGANIKSVKLTFRVKHSYYGGGLDVRIGTHNDSGKPANFHQVQAEVAQRNGVNAGSTVTVTLPDSVGNDLKNGNVRGITFGPGQSTSRSWYGYMYGPGSGSAPKLTITYEK